MFQIKILQVETLVGWANQQCTSEHKENKSSVTNGKLLLLSIIPPARF